MVWHGLLDATDIIYNPPLAQDVQFCASEIEVLSVQHQRNSTKNVFFNPLHHLCRHDAALQLEF
jgi:hypothetical protein